MSLGPLDYGDPRLWCDVPTPAAAGEAAPGWVWIGADEHLADADDRFSRAAVDALSAGDELLARDLGRLTREDLEAD